MVEEPLPDPRFNGDRRLVEAERISCEVLQPNAEAVDHADGLPASHLDALRAAGLYSVGTDPFAAREAHRLLARGCGATAFLWVQHLAVHRQAIAGGSVLAASLGDGRIRAGIMFAHLRRPTVSLRAYREVGGWRIDGEAPFASGWGIVDLFGVGAETEDGRIVWFALHSDRLGDARIVAELLPLAVMNASRTAKVRFDGLLVGDEDVILIEPKTTWISAGRTALAAPPFAALGAAERSAELLGLDTSISVEVRDALAMARAIVERPVDLGAWAAFRTECLLLGVRAAAAAVASAGGSAMEVRHPAQRLAREAMFYLVWQQTPPARAALVNRLSRALG